MKYYKLYLQTKEGKFISAYSPGSSLEYELGKHYTWREMKIPEITTEEAKKNWPDAYWFKTQTILRVVEEISKEQVIEIITQAHKEG